MLKHESLRSVTLHTYQNEHGNQGFIISQAVWVAGSGKTSRNPSLFRRRRRFHPESAAWQWQPTISNKGGNPDMGACYMGLLNDSHNASLGHKLAALKTKDPLNTDFLQWMLPAVNLFPYKHNFE